MRCYSHLSDDERERIGLAKALGHSIGAIAHAIGRPKSTISRELSRNKLPSGRYSPLHAAGSLSIAQAACSADRTRSRPTNLRCRPPRGGVDPGANFRLAEGRKRTSSAGRELRDDLRLHLSGSPKGRAVVALSHASSQNAAGHAGRDLRKIPSRIASPSTNGPKLSTAEPRAAIGRVTSSFVSAHGRCSFFMSANPA